MSLFQAEDDWDAATAAATAAAASEDDLADELINDQVRPLFHPSINHSSGLGHVALTIKSGG